MTDVVARAREAMRNAWAPYSEFRVGAAIEAADGRVFVGCNVESASYGLTICAERMALGAAVAAGARSLRRIAVTTEVEPPAARGECTAHRDYKRAIVESGEDDIVLTERVTGVPLAVIRTPYVERVGTKAGPLARWLLRHRRTKHLMRTIYALRSAWRLKRSHFAGESSRDYWQAGRSVRGITSIEPAGEIVRRFAAAVGGANAPRSPAR